MGQPTYQELIAERDWLRNRVRELEEEDTRISLPKDGTAGQLLTTNY